MNAEAFRQYYDYHFAENRKTWEWYIVPLSQEQFVQAVDYSVGSVRNQVVHMINVDNAWFSDLRGDDAPEFLEDDSVNNRDTIRAYGDAVEQKMRDYLANLQDEMLLQKPFSEGEDKDLILWQILLHVVNHGTDHRAQLLRILHDLDVKTGPQDYVFYAYETV